MPNTSSSSDLAVRAGHLLQQLDLGPAWPKVIRRSPRRLAISRTRAAGSISALTTAAAPAGSTLLEQAQLGGEIGFHRRVVVEMVARQIGESRGGKLHAVQPILIEAVAGGLDRQVIDLAARQLGQDAVQLDRIRRGQRSPRS